VDNWSTDWSIEYLKNFRNIKIIENGRNLWYGAGKNILVKESSWEYVFMLDNDIELPDDDF
jgi:GT2 family glycosyltransferase